MNIQEFKDENLFQKQDPTLPRYESIIIVLIKKLPCLPESVFQGNTLLNLSNKPNLNLSSCHFLLKIFGRIFSL